MIFCISNSGKIECQTQFRPILSDKLRSKLSQVSFIFHGPSTCGKWDEEESGRLWFSYMCSFGSVTIRLTLNNGDVLTVFINNLPS